MQKYKDLGFGYRYDDAHLSKIQLPEDITSKIAVWYKNPHNMFIFCGNPGVGKTYLCAAVAKQRCEENKFVYYITEREFFNNLRKVIQQDWDYEYEIKKIAQYPFVILDDIGSSQMTDWQKEVLFSFLDYRSKYGYPTIFTSNLFIKNMLEIFSERFVSRIKDKNNIVIELNWIDKRQKEKENTND